MSGFMTKYDSWQNMTILDEWCENNWGGTIWETVPPTSPQYFEEEYFDEEYFDEEYFDEEYFEEEYFEEGYFEEG